MINFKCKTEDCFAKVQLNSVLERLRYLHISYLWIILLALCFEHSFLTLDFDGIYRFLLTQLTISMALARSLLIP